MQNGRIASATAVGNFASSWSYLGTGDFHGDGMSDILWQYTPTETAYDFTMSGPQIVAASSLGNFAAGSWSHLA
jgi:hypothetical protein